MSLNKLTVGLILVLVFSTLVRMLPAIYTKMPFSNDVWPLIGVANTTLLTGRIPGVEQGGHHVNWPLSVLMSITYSIITECDLILFYQYIGVAMISVSATLLCYTIVERLVKSKVVSLIASLGLTLWPSYTLYTSAFLKESFAHGILLLLVYLFTYMLAHIKSKWLFLTIIALYVSLLMSHPITSAMFVAFMISYIYVMVARCIKWRICQELATLKYVVLTSIATLALNVLYNLVHIKPLAELKLYDLLVLLCYALAVYMSQILLPTKSIILLILVFASVLGLNLIRVVTAPLNEFILIFTIPVLPALISIIRYMNYLHRSNYYLYLRSYTLPIITLVLYVATYAVHLLGILHRFLNYIVYTLSFSLVLLTNYSKKYTLLLVIALSALTFLCSFACATGKLPFLYYWTYSKEDLALYQFLGSNLVEESTVMSDPKFSYMIRSIKPLSLTLTTQTDICNAKGAIILPAEVFSYGYPVTPVDYIKLDFNLYECRNLVYASRRVLLLGPLD